jgi:segregation and condensation protein A
MLQQKRLVEEAIWSNPQMDKFLAADDTPGLAVSLFDLVKTFQAVLDRAKNRPIYEIGNEDISVPDMVRYLESVFRGPRKSETISAVELFEKQTSRRAMICLFLALLELVKRGAILLTQRDAFGDIGLKRHKAFEEALGPPESLAAMEQEYH